MFAIVDIETTGSYSDANCITEISIYIHDKEKITDHFQSLVNPGVPIPPYIQSLTGIDDEMLKNAPVFNDIAPRIYDMLKENIFVAHSVNFDYPFVKKELYNAGFDLKSRKLCTVRLSRAVFPGHASYSLGNICGALNIQINGRHRADGDARATVSLFEKILAFDHEGFVDKALKRNSKEQLLPPNLSKKHIDKLPERSGIYFFHDSSGKIIYIGKALNLKARVLSHFSNNSGSKKKQDLIHQIRAIEFSECGTELMSLIMESIQISSHKPPLNKAQKIVVPAFGIYTYTNGNGHLKFCIEKSVKRNNALRLFPNYLEAEMGLREIALEFNLCAKLAGLRIFTETCNRDFEEPCYCENKNHLEIHNSKMQIALKELNKKQYFCIIDKGRHDYEKSCVLVENGHFVGMGYVNNNDYKPDFEIIKSKIKMYRGSFYIDALVNTFARQNPEKVIYFENTDSETPIETIHQSPEIPDLFSGL